MTDCHDIMKAAKCSRGTEVSRQWGADETMYMIRGHVRESTLETTKFLKNITIVKIPLCKILLIASE